MLKKTDLIYCANQKCPFTSCLRHLNQLKSVKDRSQLITVSSFDATCRRYIRWLVDENIKHISGNEKK